MKQVMEYTKQRLALSTGVELDVFTAGDPANPPIIFLHGFPESHRTWRHQMAALSGDYFCIAPDQRGYAESEKPADVGDYTAGKIVADLFALADALSIDGFTLVGHDWGGAIVWLAALQQPKRVERLIVCNGPHPLIFQRTLFDDMAQREASQYIRRFRNGDLGVYIAENGFDQFFDNSFMQHVPDGAVNADDRAAYLHEWSQPRAMESMINWYRASTIVVPPMKGSDEEMPERPAFIDAPFPTLPMPTLVVWGKDDKALLPCQLEELDDLVEDVTINMIDCGHFVPWEAPDAVNRAMQEWLSAKTA